MILTGVNVKLRAMEPNDLEAMYQWENDTSLWHLNDNATPFSRRTLSELIDRQNDIFANGQLRMIIDHADLGAIGAIDLYDLNPLQRRAGVGILVHQAQHRGLGFGTDALRVLSEYAFRRLGLWQLYADIPVSNAASMQLFTAVGFAVSGRRLQWVRSEDGTMEDVWFVQKISGHQ